MIKIIVEDGCVIDVQGLREGETYEIDDRDILGHGDLENER